MKSFMRLYLKAIYCKTHVLVITQLIQFRCGALSASSDIRPLRNLVLIKLFRQQMRARTIEKRDN
jgi:hypothetical protein